MPLNGFTTITIPKPIDAKIVEAIERANEKAGFRRFRSKAHYIEWCISQLSEENAGK